MSSELSDNFREVWSYFDPNATSFIKVSSYPSFLLALGEPLGWDITYKNNYLKQREYLTEVFLPRRNKNKELYFMDIFEHLVMMMIIRREIINYALKSGHVELITSPENILKQHYDPHAFAQVLIDDSFAKSPKVRDRSNIGG